VRFGAGPGFRHGRQHPEPTTSQQRQGYAPSGRPVPDQEGRMTFTFKLERLDGTPAEPSSFETTVLSWSPGDTIPLGRTGRCR
jgi:hypothetical protein